MGMIHSILTTVYIMRSGLCIDRKTEFPSMIIVDREYSLGIYRSDAAILQIAVPGVMYVIR